MGYVSAASVPQPRSERTDAAAAAARSRRSLAAALLLGAVGAAMVLLASGQIWAEGTADALGGRVPLEADGRDVTGAPAALAVVGLAALVAVFAVRRAGRLLVSVLLALSGAGAAVAAFLGASGGSALTEQARRTTGDAAATVGGLTHTAWPYVTAAAGLLILLAGLLALRYGASWPAMSGRYEREAGQGGGARRAVPAADPDRPEDLWKALDRGEDPTRDQ
ncbi:TIGR02234 family membrane protein [Streptomyces sp. FIT100]|uniref:TIGR02234 family membrane protein n=1 Tax=Streptomyces sp. FIT100 TaxID=2837956 RepID=UPI0021C7FD59|nr:TIGR02234 family membrane protein [Streptomyces sp. FIT100]UUN26346.1 TIGR02234 family membrane protein [Streptomyces sp. FIT100]